MVFCKPFRFVCNDFQDERGHGSGRFDELERKNTELRHENERMKNTLARFEEHDAQLQKRIDEKMHEVTQLTAMLEQVYYCILCLKMYSNFNKCQRFERILRDKWQERRKDVKL